MFGKLAVCKEYVQTMASKLVFDVYPVNTTNATVAVSLFKDGTVISTGISVCADPKSFNAELGKEYAIADAKKKAVDEIWKLEGYALRKFVTLIPALLETIVDNVQLTNQLTCTLLGDQANKLSDQARTALKQHVEHVAQLLISGEITSLVGDRDGLIRILAQAHNSWMAARIAEGWVYGPVKSVENKTSPNLVAWSDQPFEQRAKDLLALTTIISSVRTAMLYIPG